MNRRWIAGAALAAALMIPRYVRAHEGHAHKIMGTVTLRHENHLSVKAIDGKDAQIAINEKTKILRGKTVVKATDIRPGERIVVTAVETKDAKGAKTMIATEVKLAAPPNDMK